MTHGIRPLRDDQPRQHELVLRVTAGPELMNGFAPTVVLLLHKLAPIIEALSVQGGSVSCVLDGEDITDKL